MEVPCCPVTEEPYEVEGPNKPRILPCGHTISHAALEQILSLRDANRRACPVDRIALEEDSAEKYPTNYTMLEILRGLQAAAAAASPGPPPAAPPPADPTSATTVDTYAQDHLLAEYLQASWNHDSGDIGPDTVDLFGLDRVVDLGAAAPPAAAAAQARLDRPPQPPLTLADVVPPSQRMSAAAWGALESYYKLPADAVVGSPADWGPLGSDGDGCAVFSGHLHDHGLLSPVALCCGATLTSGRYFQQNLSVASFDAAASRGEPELLAAVVPHVALQLMPDVRPLLPRLHGFFTRPDGAAAGRGRLWLAYDAPPSEGVSLAAHLDAQPTSAMPTRDTVHMLLQLASALEAMHRHHFATPVLHPLSLASIHLAAPGMPAAAACILPYAHVPCGKAAPLSPVISMLEALCVPPEATAATGLVNEAKGDVWRAAAVAVVSIAGGLVFDSMDDDGWGEATLLDAVLAQLTQRCDGRRVSDSLAAILKGCLHRDPIQRWTAARLQTALLEEAIDMLDLS